MATVIQTGKLCDTCQTIFHGNGEPFPGENLEYFHHRSSKALQKAVDDGCRLCKMLIAFLPEHLHRIEWDYRASPDDRPMKRSIAMATRNPISEAAAYFHLMSDRHRHSASRLYDLGDRTRLGKLFPGEQNPIDKGFPGEERHSLVYHRTIRPATIQFWFLSSAGIAGMGAGVWPVEFILLHEGQCRAIYEF